MPGSLFDLRGRVSPALGLPPPERIPLFLA